MRKRVLAPLFFLFLLGCSLLAQAPEEERLWMPEGYRFLSTEEHQSLTKEELQEIGRRNMALMQEAIKAMTPAERQAIVASLERFIREHASTPIEKQYVTRTSMMLLAAETHEQELKDKKARAERFQKLLRDQEETTKGFPGDQKPVEAEARRIEPLIGREDSQKLYLQILKPLRARPWNEQVRLMFRRIVRREWFPGSIPAREQLTLLDAALHFLHARRAESPSEGAWDSLEAFLRLSMRGEVEEAKKLFSFAISKKSRDVESRIYPLLLAEVEGKPEEVARLLPRAKEYWPKPEVLEKVLFDSIADLPPDLQKKAGQTFQAKYKRAHPTDWEARLEILRDKLYRKEFREIENDAASVLALPLAALPEPHRTRFLAFQLTAKAELGRCAEVEPQLSSFDAAAEVAYPRELDADASPRPRTVADVRALRASLQEGQRIQAQLEAFLRIGSLRELPDLKDVPAAERRSLVESSLAELKRENAEALETLTGKDDPTIAAEWSRRELTRWENEHRLANVQYYDVPAQSEWLSIQVRSATGRCLLKQGLFERAVQVLKPCMGHDRNLHGNCISPLVDAGVGLARAGKVSEALWIYRALPEEVSRYGSSLFYAIEEAAPGTLKRPESVPLTPVSNQKP